MSSANEDQPVMICPRCRAEHPDFDGLGFVAHTKPAYADGCGWCSHPTRKGREDGAWICEICGDVNPPPASEPEEGTNA